MAKKKKLTFPKKKPIKSSLGIPKNKPPLKIKSKKRKTRAKTLEKKKSPTRFA